MRDLQVSIEDYYRLTSGLVESSDEFTTPSRAATTFVTKVHRVLLEDFGQQEKYREIFNTRLAGGDDGAETIEAFRYLRNVGQHLIHPVVPTTNAVVGGIQIGYRSYGLWQKVPRTVHRRLRTRTQALKSFYDQQLMGKEVAATLLNAARFFAEVCPGLVHRKANGEWTGFPLRQQAGVGSRLHPMEPNDPTESQKWLDSHPPGGDLRVVCGRCTVEDRSYLVGLTFRGPVSYTRFSESDEQVLRDIGAGYHYYGGLPSAGMVDGIVPYDLGGAKIAYIASGEPIGSWIGEPLQRLPTRGDYTTFRSLRFWRRVVEHGASGPLTRREERLAAWFPIT